VGLTTLAAGVRMPARNSAGRLPNCLRRQTTMSLCSLTMKSVGYAECITTAARVESDLMLISPYPVPVRVVQERMSGRGAARTLPAASDPHGRAAPGRRAARRGGTRTQT